MNILKLLGANAQTSAPSGNDTLYEIINGLGLTSNLKLCLDAGDSASYNPSVQTAKWLDTSGNGNDVYRGTNAVGDASEPTFNGTAGGTSINEYFSCAVEDYFNSVVTAPSWVNQMSSATAKFTIFVVFGLSTSNVNTTRLMGNRNENNTTSRGWSLQNPYRNRKIQFQINNGSANQTIFTSVTSFNTTDYNIVGISVDANTPSELLNINGTQESFTTAFTNTSTTGATAFRIGSASTTNSKTYRCVAIWDTPLTAQNLTDLYNGIKGRFEL